MLWRVLLLVCVLKCIEQTEVILAPQLNDVAENNTLELTCYAPKDAKLTRWSISDQQNVFALMGISEGGECAVNSFLADDQYFKTSCYNNGTFKVIIKRIDISDDGQEWSCTYQSTRSNSAFISVHVRTKYVRFKNIDGNVLKAVEKMKFTLNCETSEGRPAANITLTKISKKGIKTDITHDIAYEVSRKETLTKRNLTIVTSSIDIEPVREDNGTRIICEATNRKSYVVRQEITIHVQCPPRRPIFVFDGRIVNDSLRFISGKNVYVLCKSDSFPHPTYHWNSTGRSEYGQYLNISQLQRSDTWQCTTTNNMILPNKTTTSGKNSSMLDIHLFKPLTKPILKCGEGNHTVNETWYAIRDDDVTLLCHSIGDPAPHYNWLGQSTGAKLHISSIQTNTNKTCKADNGMRETTGEVRTSSENITVSIIVTYPPGTPYLELSGHMEVENDGTFLSNKLIIKEGSTLTVTCKADGFPPPACTWSVPDGRKNSPDLTLTDIKKDAIGLYTCYAENVIKRSCPAYEDKKKTSKDLEIDVLYQSTIEMFYVTDTENENISKVTVNDTIIFNCSVDSNPESEIVLRFKEKELRRNVSTITLIHTHKITSCFDDGVYNCIAKNRFNSKSSSKELNLTVRCAPLASPEFDLKTNISSSHNMTVTFQFKAIANPKPEFHWFKLSGPFWYNLKSSNKSEIQTVDYHSNLTVRNITEKDYGIYKLRIQNDIGSLEQLYFLYANVPPSKLNFTLSEKEFGSSEFTVNRSEEVSLECFIDSDLPSDEMIIRKKEGGQLELTKNTTSVRHTFPNVSCDDSGMYTCLARTMLAVQQEIIANLILMVQCPPVPSTKNKEDEIVLSVLNTDVPLRFKVYEYFDESNNTVFIWYKQNSSLQNDGSKYNISSHGFLSELVIRDVTFTDFGQYRVLARNSYGEYIHFFELREKEITKEQELVASINATTLLGVTGGALGFIILAAVLISIGYRHIRREHNDWRPTVFAAEVNDNPRASSQHDNITYCEVTNHVYEQVHELFTEGAEYLDIQSINSEDSTKYYITPTI